ncbi:hypothetical protein ScalyP_jg8158 [Parmales sp. scaly parma]|nr:hypothetical protein ScalyP_jg8158 [Parmales sp. scaly parma]|tara:strand:- start:530 stop:856 length:327 start_codon:yes stop_codon:yes gene_type:complete
MSSAPPVFPQLNLEQAKSALKEALDAFLVDENKVKMENAIADCGDDPMKKMMVLIPLVQSIQGEVMKKYGFDGPGAVMAATMQINMFAPKDAEIANGVRMLAAKLQGN